MSSAAEDDEGSDVWYFAIGSMMNPTSLRGRRLVPLESFPAELLDFELIFFGSGGMAAAQDSPGKSLHGVLHRMSEKHMAVLDNLERGYHRQTAQARDYSGRLQDCTVYVKNEELQATVSAGNVPPSERYLDILCEGAAHFGVDASYVTWLRSLPFRPRKRPEERVKIEVPPGLPFWTTDDIDRGSSERGPPFYFEINGKVLKYVGPSEGLQYDFVKNIYSGNGLAFRMASNLYDPKYGLPSSPADVSSDRLDDLEDYMATGMLSDAIEVVALLKGAKL